jgi:hypothetical protein
MSLLLFAPRRKQFIWLSIIIFWSQEDSKSITLVKPGILQIPDSFTMVSKRKCAFQEFWRGMVAFLLYESYCCRYGASVGGSKTLKK